MVDFKLVDEESFEAVLALKVSQSDEQARFVAPNVRSLAEAWLYRNNGDVFPHAVWYEEQVVGFLLLEIDPEEGSYFIWHMMIGQQFQGQGYGRALIEAVIDKTQKDDNCDHIIADYVVGNDKMKHLLESLGFMDRGKNDYNEVVMRLDLTK